ncbi:Vacuole-localized protein [Sphaerulina musiva]
MLYKLSVLALVGATYALPNAPAYGAAAPPAYGAASSSSSKSPASPSSKPVSSSTEAPKYSTTSAGSQPTASCPAAGTSDSHGRYSCNPAHSYPAGQTCKLIDGCYFIEYPQSSSEAPKYPSYTTKVYPSYTTYCPHPTTLTHGPSTYVVSKATTLTLPPYTATESQPPVYHNPTGGYSSKGSLITYATSSTATVYHATSAPVYSTSGTTYYSTSVVPSYSASTWLTSATVGKPTTYPIAPPAASCPVCPVNQCPPPVTVTVYSSMAPPPASAVNSVQTHPAPAYSASVGTHPAPVYSTSVATQPAPVYSTSVASQPTVPAYKTTGTVPSQPASSSACPAPGTNDSQGRYSCNPAHTYPAGQTCKLINGCYLLEYPQTSSGSASMPAAYPSASSTAPAAYPTSSSACPASGTKDNQGRYSCNPAHTYPAGQTCKLINGCYLLEYPQTSSGSASMPAAYPSASSTAPAAYPTSSSACPASGTKDSQGRYSCNPAHTYPEGQTCTLINGCYLLQYPQTSAGSATKPAAYPTSSTVPAAYPTSSSACPASGTKDSQGRYSCNPAHTYPEGQTCKLIDGCYLLEYPQTSTGSVTKPAAYPTSSTVPAAYPTSSSACPASGTKDSQGRYSCNPAHTYPEGQTCTLINGCYLLQYPSASSTVPAAYPTSSSACPASGAKDSQGRYSCNPAHTYPEGQTCTLVNGCYLLQYPSTSSTVPAAYPTSSSSACPASGAKDSQGRYSCNPAHAYPEGQTCKLINGCYLLETPKTSSTVPAAYPTSSSSACPASGAKDSQGRYSCNPAHAYPEGQTCTLINGCYLLETPKTSSTVPAAYPTSSSSACPASGAKDSQGRYSCNPAHAYPEGQTCTLINGCYLLETSSSTVPAAASSTKASPPAYKPSSTAPAAYASSTPVAPPAYGASSTPVAPPAYGASSTTPAGPASYPAPTAY